MRGKKRTRGLAPAGAELLAVGMVMELYILQQLRDVAAPVQLQFSCEPRYKSREAQVDKLWKRGGTGKSHRRIHGF